MKKHTLVFLGLILLSIILYFINPDDPILRAKLGFTAKVNLVVGIIGLWLFSILPNLGKSGNTIDVE